MRAVLDSCVLFPASLRDFLIELATTPLYMARWSEEIHREWIENLLEQHSDLKREQLEYTKGLMNKAVRGSVVTGYEGLVDGLVLPDPDDRHVLAVAIHAQAEVIVTLNLRHFPKARLEPHGVRAVHPDAFVLGLLAQDSQVVLQCLQACQKRLKNPPRSMEEHLVRLERTGLVKTAEALRGLLENNHEKTSQS
jgi:predicted nucleic acid-binding protein